MSEANCRTVRVRVPASATNLGPGFDVLGLALDLHNELEVRILPDAPPGHVEVLVEGEGAAILERDTDNLAWKAIRLVYETVGAAVPALELRLHNAIPVSRGLGSSSTAIVGGLVAANALLSEPLDPEALLKLAVGMEGHPDNVTPALLGGFQVMSLTDTGLIHLRLPTPQGLRVVVCIPDRSVSTAEARRTLPNLYLRSDAVFNMGRTALLVAGLLTGETGVLRAAMEDRIHQPYRARLIPGFHEALAGALDAGALGACLSGSGSTMLAFTQGTDMEIGQAMVRAVRNAGADAEWRGLAVAETGAVRLGG